VISLKKFLSTDNETERALLHVVHVLAQGIARHGGLGDADSRLRFQENIDRIVEAILGEITQEELLVQAGAAVTTLEEHRREFTRHQDLHHVEFQKMVKMLTSTVAVLSATGETNAGRLAEIEQQMVSASGLDDVRMIKSRLAECLSAIRKESERQRREVGETIDRLRQGLEGGERSPDSPEATERDGVTGLPQRAAAEAALCNAGQAQGRAFAGVLVLDRLQALNTRFGRSVGDEVLAAFAATVAKQLPPVDRLFRWGGPALVTLVSHAGNIEQARGDIARIVEAKVEHSIETQSRSILIPIAVRWTVFPMMAAPRLLFQRIDTFASVVTRD